MTVHREPDQILAAWLEEGPTELPTGTRRAILTAIPTVGQRRRAALAGRAWAWRSANVAAGLAVLVLVLGLIVGAGILGGPTPSPSLAPSPSASAAESPSSTLASPTAGSSAPTPIPTASAFVSTLNRFSLTLPGGWPVVPASVAWDGTGAPANDAPVADQLLPPPQQGRCQAVFVCAPTLWAVSAPFTGSLDAWTAARDAAQAQDHPCPATPEARQSIRIDGTPAVLETTHCPSTDGPLVLTASVVRGGRGYVFALQDNAREAAVEALDGRDFAALLATVRLSP